MDSLEVYSSQFSNRIQWYPRLWSTKDANKGPTMTVSHVYFADWLWALIKLIVEQNRLSPAIPWDRNWSKPASPIQFSWNHECELHVALGSCLAFSPFWKFPHEQPRMAILKDTWLKVEGAWKDFNYAHVNLVGLKTWSANPPFWLCHIPPVLVARMSALCLIQ